VVGELLLLLIMGPQTHTCGASSMR
jgi:hypothetical protein